MEILDCTGKNVKISKGSITVKSDNGKTAGIVRDIRHFKDIQVNKQWEYFHLLKNAGLWGNKKIDLNNIIIKENTMYLFRNVYGMETLRKFDPECASRLDYIHSEAENNGIKVIECEFV